MTVDEEDLLGDAAEAGVEGLQVELFYSYLDNDEYGTDRSSWINDAQDELNDFLEGKRVYSMEMDFAGEDKDRIYGSIIYLEE